MNNSFIQMDYTLQLHLDSNLSKERWAQLFQGAEYYMASPGGRFYWKTYGREFNHLPGSEFVRLVDAAYEKHEPLAVAK